MNHAVCGRAPARETRVTRRTRIMHGEIADNAAGCAFRIVTIVII